MLWPEGIFMIILFDLKIEMNPTNFKEHLLLLNLFYFFQGCVGACVEMIMKTFVVNFLQGSHNELPFSWQHDNKTNLLVFSVPDLTVGYAGFDLTFSTATKKNTPHHLDLGGDSLD